MTGQRQQVQPDFITTDTALERQPEVGTSDGKSLSVLCFIVSTGCNSQERCCGSITKRTKIMFAVLRVVISHGGALSRRGNEAGHPLCLHLSGDSEELMP